MFDATNGKRLFRFMYDGIIEHEDVAMLYDSPYYDLEDCWQRLAMEHINLHMHPSVEEMSDLMAYVMEANPDNTDQVFFDGFLYLLAKMLMNEYEMGV